MDQIREHGGLLGLRDENALESALARTRQRWHYEPRSDLAERAAAYAFGISSNHPFRDGNKRVAFLAAVIFLGLNGTAFLPGPERDGLHSAGGRGGGEEPGTRRGRSGGRSPRRVDSEPQPCYALKAEADEIRAAFLRLLESGVAVDAHASMEVAERRSRRWRARSRLARHAARRASSAATDACRRRTREVNVLDCACGTAT